MDGLKRFLRDPLLHFLLVGGLLFVAFRILHPAPVETADDSTIVVDRAKLLTFLQYESNVFKPQYFAGQFDAMSAAEKQALIDKYVREEALFREAGKLGLTQGDYVIRRRMIQKMRYLIDDTASESFAPSDDQLRQYFLAHQDKYRVAPSLTFTHVFIDNEVAHPGGAKAAAEKLKAELMAKGAGFNDAPNYGDRYPYGQNYVKMTPDYVANELGPAFTKALMALGPSDHDWQGPIKSRFGYHIVLLTEHKPSYLPKFAEVRDAVKQDMQRDTVDAYQDKAVRDLVAQFKVKLDGVSLAGAAPRAAK